MNCNIIISRISRYAKMGVIRIIFLTKALVSLLCILIGLYSGELLRTIEQLSNRIPKLVFTFITILCILELGYSVACSFIFFIIWDVRNDTTLFQTIVSLIVTSILLYLFKQNTKNSMMIILTVIWCSLMTYYFVYLFNHFFLLV